MNAGSTKIVRGEIEHARALWEKMRADPYFLALAVIGSVGVIANAAIDILDALTGAADVYLGAGFGFFGAREIIVRIERRRGELPPGRVRQIERRGVIVGGAIGGLIFLAGNAARALI